MSALSQPLQRPTRAQTEHESKLFLAALGIPVAREELAASLDQALEAAGRLGYPVVLKASGQSLAHKSERGLVALDLRRPAELEEAWRRLRRAAGPEMEGGLVGEMVAGSREFLAGMSRDPQFGPTVTLGLGGVFAEALGDVAVRVAPLGRRDALEMMDELKGSALLGPVRGLPAVDREILAQVLIALGDIGLNDPTVSEIDINPLKIDAAGRPLAVDALVVRFP